MRLKFSSEMFTDEILVQIERKSGSEEAAAHYTSERTACDTKNILIPYNFQDHH